MGRVAMLGLVLLAGLSCTRKVSQEGGLELMLMSDLPTTDLTRVHLEISQESAPGEWHKVFDREQLVPGEVSLPTTASIEAGHSPNQGALIVFTGQKESVENGQRGCADARAEDRADASADRSRRGAQDVAHGPVRRQGDGLLHRGKLPAR